MEEAGGQRGAQPIIRVRDAGVLEMRRAGCSWEYLGGQTDGQQVGQSHGLAFCTQDAAASCVPTQALFLHTKLAFVLLSDRGDSCCIQQGENGTWCRERMQGQPGRD